MLYLSKKNEPNPCFLSSSITSQLKYHQIEGLRFLYRNMINDTGVILNDATGLGKRATIAALLSAAINKLFSSVLILCVTKDQIDNWIYILQTFVGLENLTATAFENARSGIVVENIQSKFIESLKIDFDCIILECSNLTDSGILSNLLSKLRTKKKIIVTDDKIVDDLEKLWLCVHHINSELVGDRSRFLNKFENKTLKNQQILFARLRNILLRREICDIDKKDIPIVDEQENKKRYKIWKKNKVFKLTLSDSQSSSNSASDSQKSSSDLDIFKMPKEINKDDLPTSCNKSEKSISLQSHTISPPRLAASHTVVVPENLFENPIIKKTENIQSSASKSFKTTCDVVSAHIVSPSDYTSDETFETLNLLFSETKSNLKKKRSPKKRKVVSTNQWIECKKISDTKKSSRDLMLSSDDSSLEFVSKDINKTGDQTRNQREDPPRYDEAEHILDNIFFS